MGMDFVLTECTNLSKCGNLANPNKNNKIGVVNDKLNFISSQLSLVNM